MTDTRHVSPAAGRRRMTLEIDMGVEPLTGVVYADGVAQPFAGWLALASAIERFGRADLPRPAISTSSAGPAPGSPSQ